MKNIIKENLIFLTSMREYRDEMSDSGYELHYKDFNYGFESSFVSKLEETIELLSQKNLYHEIEDKEFESTLLGFLENQSIEFEVLQSLCLFMTGTILNYQEGKRTLLLENFIEKLEKS